MCDSHLTYLDSAVKMPMMDLPVRSTLVHLANGQVLISPHPRLTTDDYVQMGKVSDIVAPNCFHHLGARKARQNLTTANIWAVPGLPQKRKDLAWDRQFGRDAWPYDKELPCHVIQGMPKVNEVVFFHRESATLICADLCFNLSRMKGFGARFWLGIFGTFNQFAVSRLFKMTVKDHQAFQKSLSTILEWPIKKIVMGHGLPIHEGAKDQLIAALKRRHLY